MAESMLSFVIPSFNRGNYIRETLESVAVQSAENWECVIVDDGSTDSSISIIEEFVAADDRYRFYRRDRGPKGACTCRNIGVQHARGDYLMFLDTDDLVAAHCVEQRLAAAANAPGDAFIIFASCLFEETPFDLNLWWNVDNQEDELLRQLYQDAICQGTGAIWSRSFFESIGGWDENLHLWQDVDLFLRVYLMDAPYSKRLDLPVDLHIRRLKSSLSRQDFFHLYKQKSRVRVVKRAASLMRQHDKHQYLRELRFMVGEVVMGLIRSGEQTLASHLIAWAVENDVVNSKEERFLFVYRWLSSLRLTRIGFLEQALILSLQSLIAPEPLLGKVAYQ